jgi:hypothetical protein
MWWIIAGYVIFCVIVGGYVGKQSLSILKYPRRYKPWVHVLFFPSTHADGGVERIWKMSTTTPLLEICGVEKRHIDFDDNAAREKRAQYLLGSMFCVPFRLIYSLSMSPIIGIVFFVKAGGKFLVKIVAKCTRCIDI